MSQIHEMTTSPWGHSVVTVLCPRYMRWPHHHEVTVLSQYDVTNTQDDHITLRTQWCHSMMSQVIEMSVISVMSQIYEMTTSSWGHSVVTGQCSPCEIIMISKSWHHNCEICGRSQWYKLSTSPWCHNIVTIWCHRYTWWLRHHEGTVSSQCDVTDTWDDHIIMRSQCCHRTMLTMWDHYYIKIMTSPVWDFCEVTVIEVEPITWRSQCCHSMMSQVLKVTTSPLGHSAVTWQCSPYEVTMMYSWYQNYDITCVRCLLRHSDKCLPHNHEVTVLSQYYVTGTRDDHIIMKSQCCHKTMPTLCGHYDVPMISKLWHHMCEMCVRSQWQKFTTSLWGHSVVKVRCLRDTRWPHHYEVTVLSHCDVTDTRDDHITMRL